ncbi:MAG: alpha/beta fold hydrolase BchO, partial [Myxococcota bacterium]
PLLTRPIDIEWPHRDLTQRVEIGGVRWNLLLGGSGPCVALLHGTGASTHSYRDLVPLLLERFTVVVPDLPGHAFTSAPAAMIRSMPEMARALGRLFERLGLEPTHIVGHSAGAAIAARMSLDGIARPDSIISINGALLPFDGLAGFTFPAMAKITHALPFVPAWVARSSDRMVERVLERTGSTLESDGIDYYRILARQPSHIAGVLAMTAGWELDALAHQLPGLQSRLRLVAGALDQVVPVERSERVHRLVPESELIVLEGVGHLAHEEVPERIFSLL